MKETAPRPLPLKRNIAWNTFGCLFYQGCQWLITIVVVWLSGYEDAGVLALAMAVGNIFNAIGLYKMRTFQVSDVNDAYTQGNYAAMRFITIGLAFLVCVPYAVLTTQGIDAILAVIAFLLFKADEGFADFLYGVDQRGERMDYIGISQIVRGALSLGGFAIALGASGSLIVAISCMFAGCFAVTILFDLPHARRFETLRPRIYGRTALALLASGLPAVLAVVANIAVVSVSRQFLGAQCGEEALGVYASIATPATLMQAAVGFLYTPMIGSLSRTHNEHDADALKGFLRKMFALTIGSLLLSSALLIAVGPWLLTMVFGPSIVDSLWIFPWSILCTAMIALISLTMDILIVFRRTTAALISCASAFFVAVAIATPFIGMFGMNGINLSISLSYALGIAIALVVIARVVGERSSRRS